MRAATELVRGRKISRMTSINRRDACVALSSILAMATLAADAQPSQRVFPGSMPVPTPPGSPADAVLAKPRAFRFGDLPIAKTAVGETRAVTRGVLPTGEAVELHETTLLPGQMPHPAHKHRHTEFILVREGTIEFENDGKPDQRVGPGGVLFMASDILHGLKNVGDTTANYFVIAIGRETPA
jgi:quercetin dioxygenase-like cupin family protein